MLKIVQAIFVALTVFSAASFAKPTGLSPNDRSLSNAARMARGLPPRAPKFGRYAPGGATPTIQARQAGPSSVARTGTLAVTRADNGAQVGFLSRLFNAQQQNGVTPDINNAQTVSFTSGTNPFEITKTGAFDGSNFPLLGLVVDNANTDDNLAAGSANSVDLAGVAHTDIGSPPQPVGNTYSNTDSESTVFNYDDATGQVTATWINTDSTAATTIAVYNPDTNTLAFTGDVAAYVANNANAYAVVYTLQP